MGMFDLIKLLAEDEIDFVLVGGLAVALQGYQRVTMDVDVVLAMDADNLDRFIAAAMGAGLRPTIPVPIESLGRPDLIEQWHREKGMPAFSLRRPDALETVLNVLVKPAVPYADLRRDALMVDMGTARVAVASIPHLIAMKTGTGRGKDMIDIDELQKLMPGNAP